MELSITPSSPGTPGTIDDTPLIQAQLMRLRYGGGGVLKVGAGRYQLTAPLTIPPFVRVVAESRAAQFVWLTDLGSGVAAVSIETGTGQATVSAIENLLLLGPAASATAMDGFSPMGSADLIECEAQGFRAGCVIRYDHNGLYRCRFQANHYNVYFGDGAVSSGNHQFMGCWLDGPLFASVAVAGDNVIDGAQFLDCHLGFGPYGFYKFDGPGGPSVRSFIVGTAILNCAFEQIGNAAILDESTGTGMDSFYSIEIRNTGFIWGPGFRIPSRPADWAVQVRRVTTSKYFGGEYPFTSGDVGVFNATGYAEIDWDCGSNALPGNFLGSGSTWCSNCGDSVIRSGENWWGKAYRNDGPDLSAGQIVEYTNTWYAARQYGTTLNYAGVAMNAAPANGQFIAALRGIVYALSETVSVVGSPLYQMAGAPYLSPTPNGDVLGVATGFGGAPGGAIVATRIKL